ncbi:MAG TPA: phosphoribosylglycinamide formyltransferase [Vicinamibacterales bacterium]
MEKRPVPLIGVLISGRGSNLRALVEASLPARIAVVISNRADAAGLAIARAAGIESLVMPHTVLAVRDDYDRSLVTALKTRGVTLVCLAGFMRRLGGSFCDAFPQAILNVHPSLLPAFPGVDAQRQAIEHGVTMTGATVHFVTPELDAGPIVLQAAVPVEAGDSRETLAARLLAEEHRLFPEAVRRVLGGGWRIEGRRVVWAGPYGPPPG